MILNLILLGAVLSYTVWAQSEADNQEVAPRIASTNALDKSLMHIKLYKAKGDPGILVDPADVVDAKSELKPYAKTYVLFGGHPSYDSIKPFASLIQGLFEQGDANIISVFVNWSEFKIAFTDAISISESLGLKVALALTDLDIPIANLHFFAHCAGAEIASYTAKHFVSNNNKHEKIPRLTIFDPFVGDVTALQTQTHSYVEFMDTYHAGVYEPPFAPIGDIDFYPNAGMKQPGCEEEDNLKQFSCHHSRSIYLYIESLKLTVNAVKADYRMSDGSLLVLPQSDKVHFGHNVNQTVRGTFYLPTQGLLPHLINYF